jgi:hypothetical protein
VVISGLNACKEGIEDNFFAITIIEGKVSKIVEMKREEEEQKKSFFLCIYIQGSAHPMDSLTLF